ncbi:hypothetical protein HanIR_Chr05g0218171 [Helianthus annuus]|nr:hypothetical protein HanIR_Chr05g0218171 [Helianthus annuus]
MLLQRLQRNELLRYHYVKTELSTAVLMVSVKPFTRREDWKTNSLTDQPGSVIAYERLSTPAPTMDMTLWKAEHHHVALRDHVTGSHLSMARAVRFCC